ncbi:hypothetical protein B0A50_03031 [Salinomyces thailandicus]|uniref:Uncharacterized protein n=1 Tax=Salinomyces thailandicus TaxID=706561 RepID=A0A4U0U199_9PEZI|nr:hypothetical protein B0A50_03031 [Salinomyces thailandica]
MTSRGSKHSQKSASHEASGSLQQRTYATSAQGHALSLATSSMQRPMPQTPQHPGSGYQDQVQSQRFHSQQAQAADSTMVTGRVSHYSTGGGAYHATSRPYSEAGVFSHMGSHLSATAPYPGSIGDADLGDPPRASRTAGCVASPSRGYPSGTPSISYCGRAAHHDNVVPFPLGTAPNARGTSYSLPTQRFLDGGDPPYVAGGQGQRNK